MRSKPRSLTNNVPIEEIREKLGMTQQEFSVALGFFTSGGYYAALHNSAGCSNQLLLAAEGLAARIAPPSPPSMAPSPEVLYLLVTISGEEIIASEALPAVTHRLTMNGVAYVLLPASLFE